MAMETREAPPAHLLIKIESFSLLDKYGIDKFETREFDAGNCTWKLIFYPNGHGTEKNGGYISVFLAITNAHTLPVNWEVNAVFSIFIFNMNSGNYHYTPEKKIRRFFKMKTEWGFPKFIMKTSLINPPNGFIVDDNCVFGAEVFVNENKPVTECLSLKNVTHPHKQDLEIPNFSKLEAKWTSEEFTAGGRKWTISLYPNGHEDGIGFGLSIFLKYGGSDNKKCGERVKAYFTIRMKNQMFPDKHYEETDSYWFSASNSIRGWSRFISRADLRDPVRAFLVKDCCLLEVEISVQAVAQ